VVVRKLVIHNNILGFTLGICFLFFFDLVTHKISEYRDAKLRRSSDVEAGLALEIPMRENTPDNLQQIDSRHSPTIIHDEQERKAPSAYTKYRRTILLVVAVTLHNIPGMRNNFTT
jgi:zinc transporter ZupT